MLFTRSIDGVRVIETELVSVSLTGVPLVPVPLAVAVLVTEPASTCAWGQRCGCRAGRGGTDRKVVGRRYPGR